MEDKALDDFFAKKDKKKKSKAKFTTTDEIAKKLQDGGQQPVRKKKEKEKSSTLTSTSQPAASSETEQTQEERERPQVVEKKDEEEWKEYDEPEEKDYSGLRIQALQIGAGAEQDEDAAEPEEYDEEGELIVKPKDTATGPWKMVEATSAPAPATPTETAPEPAVSKPSGVYRPPGARLAASQPMPLPRRGVKAKAPDLQSEQQFPTLLASLEKQPSDTSDKYFERVTRGGRATDNIPGSQGPKLDLENKYAALSKH
ncbi:protein CDV3 homolog [Ptychodera flava]|uniref:protein CDV3 homolog n=1 Tax=Ptychodera flava TaxID=63121 RepID=UPI00396A013A